MRDLFDVYVAVDWSARSAPSPARESKDAIWYAWADHEGNEKIRYLRTRSALRDMLQMDLLDWKNSGKRILMGFDFAFGYPSGFAKACFPKAQQMPWSITWEWLNDHLRDDSKNKNNRWEVAEKLNQQCGPKSAGPFWGTPNNREDTDFLTGKRAGFGYPYHCGHGISLERLRKTDQQVIGVQEAWKLYGIGSVGSQTLTGIPILQSLRTHPELRDSVSVWPFETAFAEVKQKQIVLAEVFPSGVALLPEQVVQGVAEIPDRRQVRSVVHRMADLDQTGDLWDRFQAPKHLSEAEKQICIQEEGWILPLG